MKIDLQGIGKSVTEFLKRRSPEILTGIGIAGMGASVIFAVKATPKATRALKEDIERKPEGEVQKPLDKIKIVAKYYWPSAVCFATSAGCIVFASCTNYRRNAELAAAYSITRAALSDYKEAVKDLIGEKKEELIQQTADKKSMERHEFKEGNTYICSGTQVICYDPWSGRDFPYDIDELKKAICDISFQLRDEEFVSLNELYELLRLERTEAGELLGWNASKGGIYPKFSSTIIRDQPCLVLGFSRDPTDNFRY